MSSPEIERFLVCGCSSCQTNLVETFALAGSPINLCDLFESDEAIGCR
jgi:hypothetical protein